MPTYTSPASAEAVALYVPLPPDVPADLAGVPDGADTIDWSWSAVPGATGYEIEVGAAPGGPYTVDTETVVAPATTHQTTGLAAATTYYARVRAFITY